MIKVFLGIIGFTLTTIASAHAGMEQSSLLHNAIHIITTVSIYLALSLAMLATGFYLLKKLPKAKQIKVRSRVKK